MSRKKTRRPAAKATQALNALVRLQTGHGPFRQSMYYDHLQRRWHQNGYYMGDGQSNPCDCIWKCMHCDKHFIICDMHGVPGGLLEYTYGGNNKVGKSLTKLPASWGVGK